MPSTLSDGDVDWLAMRLCAADGGPSHNMELSWANSSEGWRDRYRRLVLRVLEDYEALPTRDGDRALESRIVTALSQRSRGATAGWLSDHLDVPVTAVVPRLDALTARGLVGYHGDQRWASK